MAALCRTPVFRVPGNLRAVVVPPFSTEELSRLKEFYHMEVAASIRGSY
jgi:hypothetical protein